MSKLWSYSTGESGSTVRVSERTRGVSFRLRHGTPRRTGVRVAIGGSLLGTATGPRLEERHVGLLRHSSPTRAHPRTRQSAMCSVCIGETTSCTSVRIPRSG